MYDSNNFKVICFINDHLEGGLHLIREKFSKGSYPTIKPAPRIYPHPPTQEFFRHIFWSIFLRWDRKSKIDYDLCHQFEFIFKVKKEVLFFTWYFVKCKNLYYDIL